MKHIITLLLSFCVYTASAQITLPYIETFNAGAPEWSLNTTDLGGDASLSDNQWVINNTYAGYTSPTCFVTVPATANEPSGIIGYPNSQYLHIFSEQGVVFCLGMANCNFDAGASSTYFAALDGGGAYISTVGSTGVKISFWWLCQGDATSYGQVYYRTASGGAWTLITTPITNYNLSSTWSLQTIHLAAFDGQPFLQFGFQFTAGISGNDPAFAVDDIQVFASTTPVASFTSTPTTICQDSCITFTSTSTGTIDSIRWVAVVGGFPVALLGNTSPYSLCDTTSLLPPGTYGIRLRVYSGGVADSISTPITINPAPHPVITKSGTTLSVSGTYSSYQWYNPSGIIAGATNSSYTYTTSVRYTVIVDSAGCKGSAVYNTGALDVSNTIDVENSYRVSRSGSNTITLHAETILNEALHISIYDMTGRQIFNDTWQAGTNSRQIGGLSLPPGLFIIRLNNHNTSAVLKLIE